MKKKKKTKPLKPLPKHKMLAYANNGVLTWSGVHTWRKMKLRNKIYIFVFLFIMIPMMTQPAHAFVDLFGFGVHDLYANITSNVRETNDILGRAFTFAQTSPYDVVNGIAGTEQGNRLVNIRNAIIAMALVITTLLLMVEFFKKTINFEWSSKWENILIFLVKIIVIKQVVQNADVLVGHVYAGFNSINMAAMGGSMDFLPFGSAQTYTISRVTWDSFWESVGTFWNPFTTQTNLSVNYHYVISEDAVRIFYPNAPAFPAAGAINTDSFAIPTSGNAFNTTLEMVLLQPYFLIMKGVAVAVFIIVIGRCFELALYTIFAPLPLATFASDVSNDVGKSFIKNYIACVLQIAVIVVMFMVYVAMQRYFGNAANGFAQTKLIQFVVLISLGLAVIKSGTWARKVCGIA